MHIPVVRGGTQQMLNPMTGALFFAARKEHVNAIEIRLDRTRVKFQRLIKGATRSHDVHVSAVSMPEILQMRNTEPTPGRSKRCVALHDPVKQLARAVE